MVMEEKFEVECKKVWKIVTETEKEDTTTYKAEYHLEKSNGEWVKINIASSQPLKAEIGEVVRFTKTAVQKTLMESLKKDKKKAEKKDGGGK